MTEAFISIGSNMGDRLQQLKDAIQMLHAYEGVSVLAVSSIYETEPVGYTDQADFLNVVIRVTTTKDAHQLLGDCQKVEHELGRVRDIRWGPRTVDLDILLFDQVSIETTDLVIPHPRMHERGFVLVPLLELAPMVAHPVTKAPYSQQAAVADEGVRIWKAVDGLALMPN